MTPVPSNDPLRRHLSSVLAEVISFAEQALRPGSPPALAEQMPPLAKRLAEAQARMIEGVNPLWDATELPMLMAALGELLQVRARHDEARHDDWSGVAHLLLLMARKRLRRVLSHEMGR